MKFERLEGGVEVEEEETSEEVANWASCSIDCFFLFFFFFFFSDDEVLPGLEAGVEADALTTEVTVVVEHESEIFV